MFEKEKFGLEQIRNFKNLNVPQIYQIGRFNSSAYLFMEFIDSAPQVKPDFKEFGKQLAQFHSQYGETYGWEYDNYIGSIHQSNARYKDWSEFYIEQRLTPQIKKAVDSELIQIKNLPTDSELLIICQRLFKGSKPSPLHGDLWSGNFITNTKGEVYIIDPAFYYGDREVDIAMSKLFGGFSSGFYDAYYSVFPSLQHNNHGIEFLQLYYLLVHLNLFGKSYLGSVMSILSNYKN